MINSGVIRVPDRPGWVWCRTLDNFGDDTWVMVRPSQVDEWLDKLRWPSNPELNPGGCDPSETSWQVARMAAEWGGAIDNMTTDDL